jgi:RNA polymerase sigma-70 factor (ECF subfamily)
MWLFKKKEYNSDEELLKQYKQTGNKEIFADLFKKHVTVVYGSCLFYLQDKDEAQDATMQLFEKLLLDVNNREIENFKGWLSFVVRNHCISIIRKNKSQTKNIKSYYDFEYEAPNCDTEEKINSVSDEVLLENMKLCLPKLKENQRICVELFYLKNKSYQEIANETSFTLNEIKSYIQNGKRNLKLLLEDVSTPLSVTKNQTRLTKKNA